MPLFSNSFPFPPPSQADAHGLLLVGGKLTTHWVLTAYRRGIFPWPVVDDDQTWLTWHSPDPRAVIELDELRVPRRLSRRLRAGEFHFTCNRDFAGVMAACAAPRPGDDGGTWITSDMMSVYQKLHQMGYAHSVEVWRSDQMVGGVYGVAVGGCFSGESMFHRERDASKAGLVFLARRLRDCGFALLDIQQSSPHTASLGATEIPRDEFLRRLETALTLPARFDD